MSTEQGGHERTDLNVRGVVLALAGLAAACLLVQLVVVAQFGALRRERAGENPPAATQAEGPPEPRLQTAPAEDLATVRAEEDAVLHGYAWADRGAGVVRIPIERAMELVAREAAR